MLVSYEVSVGIRENIIFIMMNIVERSTTHYCTQYIDIDTAFQWNKEGNIFHLQQIYYTLNNTFCEWIFIFTFWNSNIASYHTCIIHLQCDASHNWILSLIICAHGKINPWRYTLVSELPNYGWNIHFIQLV